MEYEIYHDESLKDGYWHGMLLVPVTRKNRLVALLDETRNNIGFFNPLTFKEISSRGEKSECAESWIQIAVASLMSRTKNTPYGIYLGKRSQGGHPEFSPFKEVIGCKLIIFRERDTLSKMQFYSDPGSKVEITFRIALVGGLHYLGLQNEYIGIERIHFDNHEQYGRSISRYRIIDRIEGLREYCAFSNRSDLVDDRSSDHTKTNSQDYSGCQLIQLTDLIIGGVRTIFMGSDKRIRHKIAAPLNAVLAPYVNPHHWKNSRWWNSMALSQCHIENEQWHFEALERSESIKNKEEFTAIQLPFPWMNET